MKGLSKGRYDETFAGVWKGFSDKILCIHVRLFKSVV